MKTKWTLIFLLIGAAVGTVGCAYSEVMNERRAENSMLRQQLEHEQQRADKLAR